MPKQPGESFDQMIARMKRERRERIEQVQRAWKSSPALLIVSRDGRRELALLTPEMSTPDEGPLRLTFLTPEGPRGHEVGTKDTLATSLADGYFTSVTPVGDAEVIAWTSTPEYVHGVKVVAFIQADNALRFRASRLGKTEEATALLRVARPLFETDPDAAVAMLEAKLAEWNALPAENPPLVLNPDEAPTSVRGELEPTAERALQAGASPPLTFMGAGMTGIVFCDYQVPGQRRAYKVARRMSDTSRSLFRDEVEFFQAAQEVPGIDVARVLAYDPELLVQVRECIKGRPGRWGDEGRLFNLHGRIEQLMLPHGWTAPEFKADSYVIVGPGTGKPVLVDGTFARRVGQRLLSYVRGVLDGTVEPFSDTPQDLAFALRIEVQNESLTSGETEGLLARLGQLEVAGNRWPSARANPATIPGMTEIIIRASNVTIETVESLKAARIETRGEAVVVGVPKLPAAAEQVPVAAEAGGFATTQRDPEEVDRGRSLGVITDAKSVYEILSPLYAKESQEVFVVIPLDLRQQPLSRPVEVARGTRDGVQVDEQAVLEPVIREKAAAFVVAHNHPSGHATPSPADKKLTKRIREAAAVAVPGVPMVDHVVIGATAKGGQFYSFNEGKLYDVKH